jgi:hypothetical protein
MYICHVAFTLARMFISNILSLILNVRIAVSISGRPVSVVWRIVSLVQIGVSDIREAISNIGCLVADWQCLCQAGLRDVRRRNPSGNQLHG